MAYSGPMASRQDLVQQLADSRKALLDEALTVPERLFAERPGENEWSVLEVVAHLIHVDYHWLAQAQSMRDNAGYLFVPFDDAKWKAEHSDIRQRPFQQVLKDVERSHTDVLSALSVMTEEELDRPGRHPRGTPYCVRSVFERYPPHDENHLAQIRVIRQALTRQ